MPAPNLILVAQRQSLEQIAAAWSPEAVVGHALRQADPEFFIAAACGAAAANVLANGYGETAAQDLACRIARTWRAMAPSTGRA